MEWAELGTGSVWGCTTSIDTQWGGANHQAAVPFLRDFAHRLLIIGRRHFGANYLTVFRVAVMGGGHE